MNSNMTLFWVRVWSRAWSLVFLILLSANTKANPGDTGSSLSVKISLEERCRMAQLRFPSFETLDFPPMSRSVEEIVTARDTRTSRLLFPWACGWYDLQDLLIREMQTAARKDDVLYMEKLVEALLLRTPPFPAILDRLKDPSAQVPWNSLLRRPPYPDYEAEWYDAYRIKHRIDAALGEPPKNVQLAVRIDGNPLELSRPSMVKLWRELVSNSLVLVPVPDVPIGQYPGRARLQLCGRYGISLEAEQILDTPVFLVTSREAAYLPWDSCALINRGLAEKWPKSIPHPPVDIGVLLETVDEADKNKE